VELDFDQIRKAASLESGRRVFEGEFGSANPIPAHAEFNLRKAASADQELLMIANWFGQDTIETYEALGGRYGSIL
jgi:hypothetical protein